MQVEVSQSWAGPYHALGYTVSKLAPQDVKDDPYPPDVLAARPQAREWGCQLVQKERGFSWETATHYWAYKSWEKRRPNTDQYAEWKSRKEALEKAPTIPPPGYVAAKPEAKPSLLDELAEVAHGQCVQGFEWSKCDSKKFYRNIATAVAKRLLGMEPTADEINKACDDYLLVKGQGDVVRVNIGRMVDALKASRRAQLAELEERA